MNKKCLIVLGAESSGTRIVTTALSTLKDADGCSTALDHDDLLDEVWDAVARGKKRHARNLLGQLAQHNILITRRSLPHGRLDNLPAQYMVFPKLKQMIKFLQKEGYEVNLMITTRSAAANIQSWAKNRLSAGKDLQKAINQYNASYRLVFKAIEATEVRYYFVSLEGLYLEGVDYLNSVLPLFGIFEKLEPIPLKDSSNPERYEELRVRLGELESLV